MFTGIIQSTGKILSNSDGTLAIEAPDVISELKNGSSIAVNGICLTVTGFSDEAFEADYMPETTNRTAVGNWKAGDLVNLELAMSANDRFEGHMVSGHVEAASEIKELKTDENAHELTVEIPDSLTKYVIPKGSITLDGISLTVMDIRKNKVTVGIIPHTWKATNLHRLKIGDKVNVETDLMAKHLEKLISKNG